MEEIRLISIEKKEGTIKYNWSCSERLKKYFSGNDFLIEYPESIENVPDGVLAIPFVASVLPISWLADCELCITELDSDFYNSISKIKNGFINMYPEATFAGSLKVDSVIDCTPDKSGGTASFFSGGLDATTTLLRHINEKPALLTLWGADVAFDNYDGWSVVEHGITEIAQKYGLEHITIHTKFRNFEDSGELYADFGSVLHTTWWYGIKHGIGIISHAAPYAWLHGINTVYIASSDCEEDGPQQCASYPTIDNNVSYCNCSTVHDGFELNRQDKVRFIVEYKKQNPEDHIFIRACWKAEDGGNCCKCEKCYRTMAGFWIEGEDPKNYGFYYSQDVFKRMYQLIALHANDLPSRSWTYMKRRLNDNWDSIKKKKYSRKIRWIRDFDFLHLDDNRCRIKYLKTWRVKSRLVKLFPKIYNMYIKFRGYKFE